MPKVWQSLCRRITHVRGDIKDLMKLHLDNAPSHTTFIVIDYLTWSKTTMVPLQSRLDSVWLFFVFPTEKRAERKALGVHRKHTKACYNVPKGHSRRGVSGYLLGMANMSPQVHWCWGRVFWRILRICTSTINTHIFLRKCALLS